MSNRLFAGTVWFACFVAAATTYAGEELPRPIDVANEFDETLRREMQLAPEDLAPPTEPATLRRRLWLDTVGYPPPQEEAKNAVRSENDRDFASNCRTLLRHPDFAENWSRYWVEVLRERAQTRRSSTDDEELAASLKNELLGEKPWSEIATNVVTSQARETFLSFDAINPGFAAGEASRVFLGISIECAECHDHPFASWKQSHYREFAAFFDQALLAPGIQEMRLAEAPEKSLLEVRPRFFLDGFSVDVDANDLKRRSALASRMASRENPWFARAFVNRICGELLGQGFYDLPDDMGPDRACVAPQALDLLADDFAASHYDVRRLFEIVLSTQTYRLQGRSHGDESFPPFACNRIQPLRSEQFLATLLRTLGMGTPEGLDEPTVDERRRSGLTPREQVREVFGYSPSQDREDVRRGVTQALSLMNSELIERAILDPNRPGGPAALIPRTKGNDELAEALYLHVLGRRPNERERLLAIDALFAAPTREEAFVDLTWALLNSAEFSHRP